MKVLIVFNQPAPYKVKLFSLLAKQIDMLVIFEKKSCPNRHPLFYANNKYDFNHIFLKHGSFGEENSCTNEIIKHLKNNKYDLIIMNGYSTLTERKTIRYLNRHHIPWTLFINGGLIKKESFIKRKYKQKYISSAASYLSPCLEANKYLLYYGAKKENIYLYPNSTIYNNDVDKEIINEKEKDNIRNKYNLPNNKIVICPSQFIKRKNNITLLEVFKNRNEHLLLIGNGKEKNKYLKFIKDNNMKNVSILEYVKTDELLQYYRASDCLITLSFEDIYGHTINEAMAKGLPVISSNKVVAANHLIKDGYNGYIVNPKDIKEINEALDKIFDINKTNCLNTSLENTFEKQANVLVETILGGKL